MINLINYSQFFCNIYVFVCLLQHLLIINLDNISFNYITLMKNTSQQTKLITIPKNIRVMNLTFVFMSIIKTMNDNNNVIIDAMD